MRLNRLNRSINPKSNSNPDNRMATKGESKERLSKLNDVKYSAIFMDVPVRSALLTNPEKINTMAKMTLTTTKRIFFICVKNLIG